MDAFLMSTGIVALAEIGDKTQLLSLLLAARFRAPLPIILGIFVATLLNHACAGAVGHALVTWWGPEVMRWVLGVSFLAMAGWMLVPDELDGAAITSSAWGVFATTTLTFFLAEMGDKTQIATVALAAQYADMIAVVMGTTLGMMLANVPAVLVGERVLNIVPVKRVHQAAAVIFLILGIMTLSGISFF